LQDGGILNMAVFFNFKMAAFLNLQYGGKFEYGRLTKTRHFMESGGRVVR
jgi:hypothetical protein